MLEEIIWKTLQDTHTGNGFQNRFSITQDKIARIDKKGSMELKKKKKKLLQGKGNDGWSKGDGRPEDGRKADFLKKQCWMCGVLQRSALVSSSHHMCLGDQTPVVRLGSKCQALLLNPGRLFWNVLFNWKSYEFIEYSHLKYKVPSLYRSSLKGVQRPIVNQAGAGYRMWISLWPVHTLIFPLWLQTQASKALKRLVSFSAIWVSWVDNPHSFVSRKPPLNLDPERLWQTWGFRN